MFIRILLVFVLLGGSVSHAAGGGNFGLGIYLGEPTGLSGQYWLEKDRSVHGGATWSFSGKGNGFQFHADYLFHLPRAVTIGTEKLGLYYGPGGRLKIADEDTLFGIRAVGGTRYELETAPVDLFLELAPILDLLPDAAVRFAIALGGHYYF